MVPYVENAQDLHRARSADDYLLKHKSHMRRLAAAGSRARIHESPDPVVARIEQNHWVSDCECGSGNAPHPEWRIACCFACGAIHRNITFPKDWKQVELALLERPTSINRNWVPGESVKDLKAETKKNLKV